MGLDVSAHLVYGIKLPEEFKVEDRDLLPIEAIEEIFYPYDMEKRYTGVEPVCIGSCDEPEIIIGLKNISVDWTAEAIDIENLDKIFQPKSIALVSASEKKAALL